MVFYKTYLVGCILLFASCKHIEKSSGNFNTNTNTNTPPAALTSVKTEGVDYDFLSTLSAAGIFDAANQIGLDANLYLTPLALKTNHSYRRYRWSVGYHANGGIMISALPPEEEMGWTPWERWYKDTSGVTRKESWVMYPLKNPTRAGVARWYTLDETSLMPRYMNKPTSLEEQLQLARIYEAATVLGFDADEVLIKPLTEKGRKYYEQCRWVVIPHILGCDDPVIYILPPMNRADDWPWESWYSDGKTPLSHHPHYTKRKAETNNSWKEYPGAPQRPPEIFGVLWYWYDDKTLKPSMINPEN
jgi:hypothetical protein